MENQVYKIYEIDSYNKRKNQQGEFMGCVIKEGNINYIKECLKENKSYHMRLKEDVQVTFFGDLDGYVGDINIFKNDLNHFLKDEGYTCDELNMEESFVYTQNEKYYKEDNPEGKSYHYTVKGLYGKNKDIGELLKKFKKNYNYGSEIDTSIYGDKWWRLPNQTKGKKNKNDEVEGTEHKIIKGVLEDFIVTYVEEGSIKVEYKKVDKKTQRAINPHEVPGLTSKDNKNEYSISDNVSDVSDLTSLYSYSVSGITCAEDVDASRSEDVFKRFIEECYKEDRYNNYDEWIKIGIALKNTYNNGKGFELFHTFSKKSKKYVCEEDVKTYWENIKMKDDNQYKLTLRSLYYWAKEDNYEKYKIIIKENMWYRNIIYKITHNDIARYIKNNMTSSKFVWVKNKLYCYDGERWHNNELEFSRFISEDLYNHLMDILVIAKKENENEFNKVAKQLNVLKQHSFKKDIINESRIYFTNDRLKFDDDIDLLGFENGVYDLKKGEFRKYKYDDYMTYSVGYNYVDKVTNEVGVEKIMFMRDILKKIIPDEAENDMYLQILSSALDGRCLEKIILFNGGGRNGKGMIDEFVGYILGNDYCYGNAPNSILTKPFETGPSPELYKINKKRLIIFKEPQEDTPIDNAVIKELTGGGSITGRQCHSNETDILLCNTTILECNKKPKFKEEPQRAEVERTIDLRFKSTFTEIEEEVNDIDHFKGNPYYKTKEFREEHKYALLHILLESYKKYKSNNYVIKLPESIKKNNEEYLEQSMKVMEFFNMNYVKTDNNEDYIKIDDVRDNFFTSEYYNSLTKQEKRRYTKKYFTDFLETYKPLRKYYKERIKIKNEDFRNVIINYKVHNND
jgi:phage/plasmid-associated DNA primase